MNLLLKKTFSLNGKVHIPGSKSQSIRALLLSLLANGKSILTNALDAEDTQAARKVCLSLGANIQETNSKLIITSQGVPLLPKTFELNTGDSGITTLFTLPLLGLRANNNAPMLIRCGQQMQKRPIRSLLTALQSLGMTIKCLEQPYQLPISLSGALEGGTASVDGLNSQYLSALLMSLPCAQKDSIISTKDLQERPYVDMTLSFLAQHHINYSHQRTKNTDTFYIPGQQSYTPLHYTVGGDFSSASCIIAAAVLLPSKVEITGLSMQDTQGDKRLLSILQKMGANIAIYPDKICIQGNKSLTGASINAGDIPDIVPALAVIATQAQGTTDIYNISHIRTKETDRIHSLATGLRKMGARIEEHQDRLLISQSYLSGQHIEGYEDHRTVMAFVVAGLLAEGETTITDGESVSKTYPEFNQVMKQLGANIYFSPNFKSPAQTNQHIILTGFKHVGKTSIGYQLAKAINKPFIDLDKEVELQYQIQHSTHLSCRQIMNLHGESYYRDLESLTLQQTLESPPCVISLGGGTLLNANNQQLARPHLLLLVEAPPDVVFERIIAEGLPAFFNPEEDIHITFNRLWTDRNAIYHQLTPHQINNNGSLEQAVQQALIYVKRSETTTYV